jgi:uncharacterized protein (DUF736 family)
MRIGIGKRSETGLRFDVDIPGLAPFPIDLEKNPQPGERGPDWLALYRGERCGALWKRVPKAGGEAYLSGVLEGPAFPEGRLEVAVFAAKREGSQKDLVWRPRQERAEGAERPARTEATAVPPPVSRGAEEDDDIPF